MRNPVLRFPDGTPNVDPTTYGRSPALMDPDQTQTSNGALNQPPISGGNARGSSRVPQIQPNLIDMRSEGLMRIGGAISGASQNGGLAAMQAGSEAYGGIMDYNRRQEDEAFALEEARRQALQTRITNAAKNANKPPSDQDMQDMAAAAGKYQTAMEVLQGFKDRDYVVGWQSYLTEIWDNVTDDPRQNIRLKLQTLKVDKILANVARTKGAISEKEMEIFASDQPSRLAGEEIWTNWVKDYAEALRVMNIRMQGGSTTGAYSDGTSSGDFTSSGPSAPDTTGYSIVN